MDITLTSDDSIVIRDKNGKRMIILSISDDRPISVKISTDTQISISPVCSNAVEINSK